jgi:hypothetical protein
MTQKIKPAVISIDGSSSGQYLRNVANIPEWTDIVQAKSYAIADLPLADSVGAGALAWVTDAPGGAKVYTSNGTEWVALSSSEVGGLGATVTGYNSFVDGSGSPTSTVTTSTDNNYIHSMGNVGDWWVHTASAMTGDFVLELELLSETNPFAVYWLSPDAVSNATTAPGAEDPYIVMSTDEAYISNIPGIEGVGRELLSREQEPLRLFLWRKGTILEYRTGPNIAASVVRLSYETVSGPLYLNSSSAWANKTSAYDGVIASFRIKAYSVATTALYDVLEERFAEVDRVIQTRAQSFYPEFLGRFRIDWKKHWGAPLDCFRAINQGDGYYLRQHKGDDLWEMGKKDVNRRVIMHTQGAYAGFSFAQQPYVVNDPIWHGGNFVPTDKFDSTDLTSINSFYNPGMFTVSGSFTTSAYENGGYLLSVPSGGSSGYAVSPPLSGDFIMELSISISDMLMMSFATSPHASANTEPSPAPGSGQFYISAGIITYYFDTRGDNRQIAFSDQNKLFVHRKGTKIQYWEGPDFASAVMLIERTIGGGDWYLSINNVWAWSAGPNSLGIRMFTPAFGRVIADRRTREDHLLRRVSAGKVNTDNAYINGWLNIWDGNVRAGYQIIPNFSGGYPLMRMWNPNNAGRIQIGTMNTDDMRPKIEALAPFTGMEFDKTPYVNNDVIYHAGNLIAATGSTTGLMSSTDKTKLDGVATGATLNATDAQLRDRATHTGSQAQSTITNLTTDLAAKANTSDVVALTGNQTIAGTKTFSSTITGSVSGNAGTATTLATPRAINGTNFDGSAAITITAANPNAVTFNNAGTGAASGSTYTGGAVLTVSHNTIGAAPLSHTHAIADVTNLQTTLNAKLDTSAYVAPVRSLSVFCSGKPANNEVIGGGIAPYAFTITSANCVVSSVVAATGSVVFSIRKNGSEIGTATFPNSGTLATLSFSNTTVAQGDQITITAPADASNAPADITALIRE